jgi:signal transduction histidine kinase
VRRRLLLSYLSITLFVLVVLAVPLGIAFARLERRELSSGVRHDALALALRSEEALERDDVAALDDLADDYQRRIGGRVVIIDAGGVSLVDSDPPRAGRRDFADRPEFTRALAGREATGTRFSATLGSSLFYAAAPIVDGATVIGAVRVSYPTSYVDDRIERNWLVLGGIGVVVLGVVFVVSNLLARSVSRPLADLEAAAAKLGAGDLTVRADVGGGPPEVRSLARSFDLTAARLERLVGLQQAFVADASHQLRSPLAALRLRLENLEREEHDPAAAADVAGALDEVARLSRLVDGLLELARAEQEPSAPAAVDAGAVVAARVAAWSALAAEREVALRGEPAAPSPVARATPGRLEQVLDNLLNNALEVAPAGSAVTVTAATDDLDVVVTVADQGPGMTETERSRAFDRFWRAGDAAPGGAGLGLAIVRELTEADHGRVALAPNLGGGLVVTVRLPAARERAQAGSGTPASA